MLMRLNLRKKINGAILITGLIVFALVSAVSRPLQQHTIQMLRGNVETLLRTIVDRDREALANEIFENHSRAIRIRFDQILKIEGIQAIAAYNSAGSQLVRGGIHPVPGVLSPAETQITETAPYVRQIGIGDNPALKYIEPIDMIGERIGYICIVYTMQEVAQVRRGWQTITWLVLLVILFVMLLILNVVLTAAVVKPISLLRDSMQQVETSGPGKQIRVAAKDEIGELSRAFNKMSAALEDSYAQVARQEAQLRLTKNFLSNIINSMPSILVGVDPEGHVTHWNSGAENLTGLSAQSAHSRRLGDVLPQMAAKLELVRTAIRKRQVQKESKITTRLQDRQCYADITIYPLVTNGIEGAVIRIDDVTESVMIEEVIVQSEKMLSVGGLAAGMAHEINNPLAGILQSTSVIRNRLLGEATANERAAEACGAQLAVIHNFIKQRGIDKLLDNINESGERAARIVQNMLGFARKGDGSTSTYDVANLMDQTIELAESDYDLKKKYDFRQIRIQRHYDENLPFVACESTKIQQVFLNILKNGAEAMAELSAKEPDSSKPEFIVRIKKVKEQVQVEITDNGPGMPETVRKRVFEPFFTTKPVNEGTGLGLSVSYFIITEQHGGRMSVSSSPGKGSTFSIFLPITGNTTSA